MTMCCTNRPCWYSSKRPACEGIPRMLDGGLDPAHAMASRSLLDPVAGVEALTLVEGTRRRLRPCPRPNLRGHHPELRVAASAEEEKQIEGMASTSFLPSHSLGSVVAALDDGPYADQMRNGPKSVPRTQSASPWVWSAERGYWKKLPKAFTLRSTRAPSIPRASARPLPIESGRITVCWCACLCSGSARRQGPASTFVIGGRSARPRTSSQESFAGSDEMAKASTHAEHRLRDALSIHAQQTASDACRMQSNARANANTVPCAQARLLQSTTSALWMIDR
nr:hypothetical protein CFP56_34909 [Quercus suber]